jgi:hypothetical protein
MVHRRASVLALVGAANATLSTTASTLDHLKDVL